jgi:adenylylsulfate kinase
MTRILIMGLPGSGKTTLANELNRLLSPNCLWINADVIREQYNDWDFSLVGRIRQSIRMRELADASEKEYVICDFIAPLVEMRDNFGADYTVWVDTITAGRYEDTNNLFVSPEKYDIRVTDQDSKKWGSLINNLLRCQ